MRMGQGSPPEFIWDFIFLFGSAQAIKVTICLLKHKGTGHILTFVSSNFKDQMCVRIDFTYIYDIINDNSKVVYTSYGIIYITRLKS